MPKPLSRSQPTSSVANLLQPGVGAAALASPPARSEVLLPTPIVEQLPAAPKSVEPTGEAANVLRQFTLTAAADRTLKELTVTYSRATGLDLKLSEILRAVLVALRHALPELTREAGHIGPLKRPKNERGNEALRDELERRIARAIIAGMRASDTLEG
jgi:hypothetical protein